MGQSLSVLIITMKHKENSDFSAPIIILVRPQMAENIGMVARAMMNCGISELRLVEPREDHLSQSALSASSGAQVILEQAKVYSSLQEATKDIHFLIATTARGRGINKPVYLPEEAVLKLQKRIQSKEQVALMFGPERTGLENNDIVMANALLTIPLNPTHPSLNLAQAVLLVGWIWWQQSLKGLNTKGKKIKTASKKELTFFLNFLIKHLENKNYFAIKNKKERMIVNLENIFTKSDLTSAEIKTLYRVVKRLAEKTN